jgi:hypothetical protein
VAVDLSDKAARNESSRLASTLRLVGIGKLVLASLTLLLAFTGYETPKAVNIGLFFVGVNLLVLGWVCLALSRSFARASGETTPPALGLALDQANKLFGYYLVLVLLAVLGVGFDAVTFLGKILSR